MKKLYIIGDAYESFAEGRDDVRTVSGFWRSPLCCSEYDFYAGLGIPDWQLDSLQAYLIRGGATTEVLERFCRRPAPRKLTHRHNETNIMVSEPRRDEDVFTFDLILDDREDRLADHVTGRHVSGMVLLEAARQAAAVALETVHADLSESHAAVLSGVAASYDSYAFPLPTKIEARVAAVGPARASCTQTEVLVSVQQLGRHIASFVFKIPLMKREILTKLEARAARTSV